MHSETSGWLSQVSPTLDFTQVMRSSSPPRPLPAPRRGLCAEHGAPLQILSLPFPLLLPPAGALSLGGKKESTVCFLKFCFNMMRQAYL